MDPHQGVREILGMNIEELGDEIETDSRKRYERLTESSNPNLLRALVKERDRQVLGLTMIVNEEIIHNKELRRMLEANNEDAEKTIEQLDETNSYHKWLKENHPNIWKKYDTKRLEYTLTPK